MYIVLFLHFIASHRLYATDDGCHKRNLSLPNFLRIYNFYLGRGANVLKMYRVFIGHTAMAIAVVKLMSVSGQWASEYSQSMYKNT